MLLQHKDGTAAPAAGVQHRPRKQHLLSDGVQVRTRAATLPRYVNDLATVLATGQGLLQPELPIGIRLMGVRMSNFQERRLDSGQRSIASFVSQPVGQRSEQQQQQQQPASSSSRAADSSHAGEDLGELDEEDECLSAAVKDEHRDWDSLDPGFDGQVRLIGEQHLDHALLSRSPGCGCIWGLSGAVSESGLSSACFEHVGLPQVGPGLQEVPEKEPAGKEQGARQTWTCMMCTWENSFKWLRCSVCDHVRGSTLPAAAEHSAASAGPKSTVAEGAAHDLQQGLPRSSLQTPDATSVCSARTEQVTALPASHAPASAKPHPAVPPKRKRALSTAAPGKHARTPDLTSFFKPKR